MIGHSLRRRPDTGYSLPELTVAMGISTIIMAAIGMIMVNSFRADRMLTTKVGSSTDLRIALESMSRALRTATTPTGEMSALVSATPSALSFYTMAQHTGSTAAPLPTLVEYSWDSSAQCLKEARTPARVLGTPAPSGSIYAWDTGRTTHCLVRTNTAPAPAAPWFTYYRDGTTATSLTAPDTGMVLADRQTVRSIKVSLTISSTSAPDVPGVQADVRVNLANVSLAEGRDA